MAAIMVSIMANIMVKSLINSCLSQYQSGKNRLIYIGSLQAVCKEITQGGKRL